MSLKTEQPCESFAPGIALPQGECENCHYDRSEHQRHHRNSASGSPVVASGDEHKIADQGQAPPSPAVAKPRPDVVYCVHCGAGMAKDGVQEAADYPCPRCTKTGPKAGSPMPRRAVAVEVTKAIEAPAGAAAPESAPAPDATALVPDAPTATDNQEAS